ncbi:MAG TPA: oxaloacetate-decarboxylating malate dehydrogenase, partial [Candidatus Limnocylindria bacterium]|nr:oxaloacetate-decarboxylating malate dehydrogenase [Candidatus Limnocylindria bacterium]
FVDGVQEVWPGCVIQWEDFKQRNALRILDRYRDRVPSFNDDVQGTAAVVLAGILAGMRHLGRSLAEQRILLVGAGAAGIGIARLLHAEMRYAGMADDDIRRVVRLVDSKGLVHAGRDDLDETKKPMAAPAAHYAGPDLADIVAAERPTILIGTTGVAGTFSREVIETMAASTDRPIVMPLSNPTAVAEARPEQVLAWSGGRAIVATGSPFAPVDGRVIGQANNVFVFPGIGLGAVVSEATRITDAMILAAARTLAGHVTPERFATGALYPPIADLRPISRDITLAVAGEAMRSGLAAPNASLEADVDAAMWWPDYVPYVPA